MALADMGLKTSWEAPWGKPLFSFSGRWPPDLIKAVAECRNPSAGCFLQLPPWGGHRKNVAPGTFQSEGPATIENTQCYEWCAALMFLSRSRSRVTWKWGRLLGHLILGDIYTKVCDAAVCASRGVSTVGKALHVNQRQAGDLGSNPIVIIFCYAFWNWNTALNPMLNWSLSPPCYKIP